MHHENLTEIFERAMHITSEYPYYKTKIIITDTIFMLE
jgi:hypothetical protein